MASESEKSCAQLGLGVRDGYVAYATQQVFRLVDGEVKQLRHPRELRKGDDTPVDVLVASIDAGVTAETAKAALTGAIDPDTLGEGVRLSTTTYAQARSSHAFEVSDTDRKRIRARLAQAVAQAGKSTAPSAPTTDAQLGAEIRRWETLAAQVGTHDLLASIAKTTTKGSNQAAALTLLRRRASLRLSEADRLAPTQRPTRERQKVQWDSVHPELKKLKGKAGQPPSRRLVVQRPNRPGALSHAELRFLQRVDRSLTDEHVALASEVADLRADAAAETDELAAKRLRKKADDLVVQLRSGTAAANFETLTGVGLADTVDVDDLVGTSAALSELITHGLNQAVFAYDIDERTSKTTTGMHDVFTLLVPNPFHDRRPETLQVICRVKSPERGTSAADRGTATFVEIVSLYEADRDVINSLNAVPNPPTAPREESLARPATPEGGVRMTKPAERVLREVLGEMKNDEIARRRPAARAATNG